MSDSHPTSGPGDPPSGPDGQVDGDIPDDESPQDESAVSQDSQLSQEDGSEAEAERKPRRVYKNPRYEDDDDFAPDAGNDSDGRGAYDSDDDYEETEAVFKDEVTGVEKKVTVLKLTEEAEERHFLRRHRDALRERARLRRFRKKQPRGRKTIIDVGPDGLEREVEVIDIDNQTVPLHFTDHLHDAEAEILTKLEPEVKEELEGRSANIVDGLVSAHSKQSVVSSRAIQRERLERQLARNARLKSTVSRRRKKPTPMQILRAGLPSREGLEPPPELGLDLLPPPMGETFETEDLRSVLSGSGTKESRAAKLLMRSSGEKEALARRLGSSSSLSSSSSSAVPSRREHNWTLAEYLKARRSIRKRRAARTAVIKKKSRSKWQIEALRKIIGDKVDTLKEDQRERAIVLLKAKRRKVLAKRAKYRLRRWLETRAKTQRFVEKLKGAIEGMFPPISREGGKLYFRLTGQEYLLLQRRRKKKHMDALVITKLPVMPALPSKWEHDDSAAIAEKAQEEQHDDKMDVDVDINEGEAVPPQAEAEEAKKGPVRVSLYNIRSSEVPEMQVLVPEGRVNLTPEEVRLLLKARTEVQDQMHRDLKDSTTDTYFPPNPREEVQLYRNFAVRNRRRLKMPPPGEVQKRRRRLRRKAMPLPDSENVVGFGPPRLRPPTTNMFQRNSAEVDPKPGSDPKEKKRHGKRRLLRRRRGINAGSFKKFTGRYQMQLGPDMWRESLTRWWGVLSKDTVCPIPRYLYLDPPEDQLERNILRDKVDTWKQHSSTNPKYPPWQGHELKHRVHCLLDIPVTSRPLYHGDVPDPTPVPSFEGLQQQEKERRMREVIGVELKKGEQLFRSFISELDEIAESALDDLRKAFQEHEKGLEDAVRPWDTARKLEYVIGSPPQFPEWSGRSTLYSRPNLTERMELDPPEREERFKVLRALFSNPDLVTDDLVCDSQSPKMYSDPPVESFFATMMEYFTPWEKKNDKMLLDAVLQHGVWAMPDICLAHFRVWPPHIVFSRLRCLLKEQVGWRPVRRESENSAVIDGRPYEWSNEDVEKHKRRMKRKEYRKKHNMEKPFPTRRRRRGKLGSSRALEMAKEEQRKKRLEKKKQREAKMDVDGEGKPKRQPGLFDIDFADELVVKKEEQPDADGDLEMKDDKKKRNKRKPTMLPRKFVPTKDLRNVPIPKGARTCEIDGHKVTHGEYAVAMARFFPRLLKLEESGESFRNRTMWVNVVEPELEDMYKRYCEKMGKEALDSPADYEVDRHTCDGNEGTIFKRHSTKMFGWDRLLRFAEHTPEVFEPFVQRSEKLDLKHLAFHSARHQDRHVWADMRRNGWIKFQHWASKRRRVYDMQRLAQHDPEKLDKYIRWVVRRKKLKKAYLDGKFGTFTGNKRARPSKAGYGAPPEKPTMESVRVNYQRMRDDEKVVCAFLSSSNVSMEEFDGWVEPFSDEDDDNDAIVKDADGEEEGEVVRIDAEAEGVDVAMDVD